MRKILMTIIVLGVLLFAFACSNTLIETPVESSPDLSHLPTEPDETPLDLTISGLFTFYKTFLDEKIRDPLLNPPLIYDTTDLEPRIAKSALLEIYDTFIHQSVTSDFFNAFLTDPIYQFDRYFGNCDLSGTSVSCETHVAQQNIAVEMMASATHQKLVVEIRMIYQDHEDKQVIHRYITFDVIDDLVHIKFAELITAFIHDDQLSIVREIHGHLIEETLLEFALKAYDNYGDHDFLYAHTNIKTQTHLLYAYNPYLDTTTFEVYDETNDTIIDFHISNGDIKRLNILFKHEGVTLLGYQRFNQTIELSWNMLEVDGWTDLLCDDCGYFPAGIYLDDVFVENTQNEMFFFYPNHPISVMLISFNTSLTQENLSLSKMGLSFTKVTYQDLIDSILDAEQNHVSIMAANGFIYQETVDLDTREANMMPYRTLVEAWMIAQSSTS